MTPTEARKAEEYTRLLYALAEEKGCALRLGPDLEGMMWVEFGFVDAPHPQNSIRTTPQQSFAIGLHEIGHFHHGHTQGRPPYHDRKFYFDNGVLQSEAEAWDFALAEFKKFGIEIEPKTRSMMWDRCMGSYYRGAQAANGASGQRLWNGDRHYVAFTYDEPTDFFWDVRRRMIGPNAYDEELAEAHRAAICNGTDFASENALLRSR